MRLLMFCLVLLMAGCAMPAADPERLVQAEQAYEWVRDGDLASLTNASNEQLRPQLTPELFAQMQSYAVQGEPEAARVLTWRSHASTSGAGYEIVRLLDYSERHVVVSVAMSRQSGDWVIDGVHINSIDAAQAAAASGFTLNGKSALHFAVLTGVVLIPLFCLVTAGFAAWRRRWGWMALSLLGVMQLSVNWATGAWFFQPINVSLLGASFTKGMGPLDPWILAIGIPLPAILFWALGRYRRKPAPAPAAAGDDTVDPG